MASNSVRESSELIFVIVPSKWQQPNPSKEILRSELRSASSVSKSAKTLPPCKEKQKLQGRDGITGKISTAMLIGRGAPSVGRMCKFSDSRGCNKRENKRRLPRPRMFD